MMMMMMNFKDYIAAQTLAQEVKLVDFCNEKKGKSVEIDSQVETFVCVTKQA